MGTQRPNSESRLALRAETQRLIIGTALLHVFLILIHVALVVLHGLRIEQRVVAPLDTSEWVSPLVHALSQAVGTLLTALLVLFTQKLSLRRELHVRQTLTALHDQTSAWFGLGSAIQGIYQQAKISTAFFGVANIALYLLLVFGIHVTTPALFDFVPFNATVRYSVSYQPFQRLQISTNYTTETAFLTTLAALQPSPAGLTGNTIYNAYNVTFPGIEDISIEANTLQASCYTLPGSYQAPSTDHRYWNICMPAVSDTPTTTRSLLYESAPEESSTLPRAIRPRPREVCQRAWPIGPNTIRAFTASPLDSDATVLFFSSFNITDPSGAVSTSVKLDPPMTSVDGAPDIAIQHTAVREISVFGCQLEGLRSKVHVDPDNTRAVKVEKTSNPSRSKPEKWTEYPGPLYDEESGFGTIWPKIFTQPAASNVFTTWCHSIPNGGGPWVVNSSCLSISMFDKYLMDVLKITPTYLYDDPFYPHYFNTQPPAVDLASIQSALENATAGVYWYKSQLASNTWLQQKIDEARQSPRVESRQEGRELRLRLTINGLPLYVGLAFSVVLLVLAIILIRRTSEDTDELPPALQSIGVLQLTWLLGRASPAKFERVIGVEEPSIGDLRAAGMVEVSAGDIAADTVRFRGSWQERDEEGRNGAPEVVTLLPLTRMRTGNSSDTTIV